MNFEDSLEHDILICFWEVKWPLSVKDVQEALSAKDVEVSFDVLQRVIRYLEIMEILQSESNIEWGKRYRPTISALKFSFNPWGYLLRSSAAKQGFTIRSVPLFNRVWNRIRLFFLGSLS